MAINLKKKVGPLPIWGWALGGAGTLGVLYYLHKSSSSTSSQQAQTDAQLAAEQQAAQDAGLGTDGGGGDAGAGGSSPIDTTGLATGSVSTDQLDSELQTLQDELAQLSTSPTDNTAYPTLSQEAQDLLNAQAAFAALGLGQTPAAPKGASPAARGKLTSLPILTQLEDLRAGLVTKSQLGPNAAQILKNANGNINTAIASRATHNPAPGNALTTAQANTLARTAVATGGVNALIPGGAKVAQKVTVAPKLPKGYSGGL